ncbi:MAG: twin-arginine translocation pathway signal protein [Marivirga sp.]|nr:twin-arginine translocation pathway signal protein [Marivirga sp.]
MEKRNSISRRSFIKVSALAGGGLLLSITAGAGVKYALNSTPTKAVSLNAFLRIGADNSIQIILSKVEMGQGMWTTLPMLIAEELDCDWKKIKVEHRPSGRGDDFKEEFLMQSTGGSDSTRSEFDRYRLAGASARVMLVTVAAARFGVSPEACRTENGYVIAGDKRISYGELATEAASLPVPTVKLREPADWKYIGKSVKNLDSHQKVNGQAIYGIDIHFPGLLTAVVSHAPVFGAKVKSFDPAKAMAVKGVREVVQVPSGIAVIADHYWAASNGREALTIEWDLGENININTINLPQQYAGFSKEKGLMVQHKGDVFYALQHAEKKLEAEFTVPYLAHAPMETLNCTVKVTGDEFEIWAGTQSPFSHQMEAAAFLGCKPEDVLFHTPLMGGSFGRRGSFQSDWVMEALHIAKATGKSIKLVWSREDDIKGGYYRPFYLHKVTIGIGRDGFPAAWDHHVVGQSLFVNTPLEDLIVNNGIDYSSVDGLNGSPYFDSVPDHSVELHTTTSGVPVLAWRAVGNTHTGFVMESLIDELAFLSHIDPVEYRRMLFKNHPRHLAALNLAAEKSAWNKPLPPGLFRGIAVHSSMGSYVSQVVELSIENKKLKVHRVVCAIDCGLAVNPDGVRAQMEGGIVFGLTAALYGEINLENGKVKQDNFNNYRMLRMNEAPSIEVYIVPGNERMGGAGEPGVSPIAPALINAVFAATGKRIRTLPLKTDLIF